MGWRPSSWWARSQDRRPESGTPTGPLTVGPTTAGPTASDSTTPSSDRPTPVSAAWRDLPSLAPTNAIPLQRIAVRDDFASGLAAHADPRFLQPLGHLVDPSIGGLVDGLTVPGTPHDHEGGPELTVPQRASSTPARPAPRVQRQLSWSGSDQLSTVLWELPGTVESPEPAPLEQAPPLGVTVPEPDSLVRASSIAERSPSVADDAPVLDTRLRSLPLAPAEPSSAHRTASVVPVQRALAVVPVAAPAASRPTTPGDSAASPAPGLGPLPTVDPSTSFAPIVAAEIITQPDHDHDLDPPVHDQQSSPNATTGGWTEVALPVAAVQRRVPVGSSISPIERPILSAPPVTPTLAAPPATTPTAAAVAADPVPAPSTSLSSTTPLAVSSPVGQSPTLTSAIPLRPQVQRSLPTSTADPASSTTSAAQAQIPVPVGIPLVQRSSAAAPHPMPAPEPSGVRGVAMSFATMFSGPVPPDPAGPAEPLLTVSRSVQPASTAPALPGSATPNLAPPTTLRSSVPDLTLTVPTSVQTLRTPSAPVVLPAPRSAPAPEPDPVLGPPSALGSAPTPTIAPLPLAFVQRQGADEPATPELPPEPASAASEPASAPDPSAEPSSTGTPTASVAASTAPPGPAAAPADLDELARRLYDPLVARIRAELWLDRERAGVFGDG